MTTTTLLGTSAVHQLVYTRSRIISALLKLSPESYGSLTPSDILSISLSGENVVCTVADGEVLISKKLVLLNFWEHRTRTPSFFDYKIWRQVEKPGKETGVPVGAIDYSMSPKRIAVDRNGKRKLYFVDEIKNSCTCESWKQLNENKIALQNEFQGAGLGCFEATCKHLRWAQANTKLQALRYLKSDSKGEYNPRLCVYSFDHRRGLLLYRITWDGIKTGGQWLPVDGWKEKPVYGKGGIPNGECWDTFFSALNEKEPFKLCPFSNSVAALMQSSRSKQ
jgi:hypothetical protein